jgi:sulfate transporter 3
MALTVMVTLLFLMPLFVFTPNVVLGAIIIVAVIGLIDIPAVYRIWKMDKMDFLVCVCAFAGVIFLSVQQGLAIAVINRMFLPFGNTNFFIKNWEC